MRLGVEHSMAELLEMNGAPIRGRNRADCPECTRLRSVSFNETAFCCHGIDCEFHGGIGTLRKRLGIAREWLPKPEYIRRCRQRDQAHEAAERLCHLAKTRRFELYDELRTLNRIGAGAHHAGPTEAPWGALERVYAERPRLLAELTILENCSATELVHFLISDETTRQVAISRVIGWGGVPETPKMC